MRTVLILALIASSAVEQEPAKVADAPARGGGHHKVLEQREIL